MEDRCGKSSQESTPVLIECKVGQDSSDAFSYREKGFEAIRSRRDAC